MRSSPDPDLAGVRIELTLWKEHPEDNVMTVTSIGGAHDGHQRTDHMTPGQTCLASAVADVLMDIDA